MRTIGPILLALLLAACAGTPAATPAPPPPAPTLPTVGELIAGSATGLVRAVGVLVASAEGAALVDGLRLAGPGAPAPLDEAGIWIGEPPLPAGATVDPNSYMVVEAAGRLEGPGRYGPGGRYGYTLAEPVLRPRSVRDISIVLLLQNSDLYEGQPVRLRGQLLTGPATALLVQSVGPGGVPDAGALQVKLAVPPADPALLAALTPAGSRGIAYGPVEVLGLWRAGQLYPLAVTPV